MRRKKINKISIFHILSILLIFVFAFFLPFFIQRFIKINTIECRSQFNDCSEDLRVFLNSYLPLDLISAKNFVNKNFSDNIFIDNYLIQYKIPATLKVDIDFKDPKYAIKYRDGIYYLIDKQGLLINKVTSTDLTSISIDNFDLSLGQKVDESTLFFLKIIEKVRILTSINKAFIDQDELRINLNNGIMLLFPKDGDVDLLCGSFRIIFSRLNDGHEGIKMEDIKEIDLRFKNVILR